MFVALEVLMCDVGSIIFNTTQPGDDGKEGDMQESSRVST